MKRLLKLKFSYGIDRLKKIVKDNGENITDVNKYCREVVLKQGKADFDTDEYGLTAREKVQLYGYYYFQMHGSSSFAFFRLVKEPLSALIRNTQVHFVDIGSGPATAGLAFSGFRTNNNDLAIICNYYAVDHSNEMLIFASQLVEETKLRFDTNYFSQKLMDIHSEILKNVVEGKDQVVIINFTFLFGSNSLDVTDLAIEINKLKSLKNDIEAKIIIFHQNVDNYRLNTKWRKFKTLVPDFKNVSGVPKILKYKFDNDLKSSNYSVIIRKASIEVLKLLP